MHNTHHHLSHVDWHAQAGLGTVFIFRKDFLINDPSQKISQQNLDLCYKKWRSNALLQAEEASAASMQPPAYLRGVGNKKTAPSDWAEKYVFKML